MTLTTLHLTLALSAALERLGWRTTDPRVRETAPTAARGHHLVTVVPPAPAYAAPALAGLLSRPVTDGAGHDILVLTPPELIDEWTVLIGELGVERVLVVRGAARADTVDTAQDLVITTPATALELRRRSRLAPERFGAYLLAWPERWEDPEALTELLQDVPRETQRVLVTSDAEASAPLVERHAWRALMVGLGPEPPPAAGPVRTVAVPWSRRVGSLTELAEALAPRSLAVWTADRTRHEEIRRSLTGLGIPVEVTGETPTPAEVVVAFDPPDHARLTQLLVIGEVVLLVPPGTEPWVERLATPRRPVPLPGAPAAAANRAARRRARVERIIGEEDLDQDLIVLAPLFERYDASQVAAALHRLWRAEERREPEPAAPAGLGVARVWVGVGRKDSAGPSDLVGLLANELKIDRSSIGRIDVRETYSLIEVPADAAERIATAITGRTVRRRRLAAKVDRKR